MRTLCSLSLALVVVLPGLAHAITINASWTGSIDFVKPEVASAFPIGTPASGSFQIDTAIADANSDPSLGLYPGAATAIVFRFGSYEFNASLGTVSVADTLGDAFTLGIGSSGVPLGDAPPIEGITVESILFHVESGLLGLSSDAIPLSLDLATFHGGAYIVPLGGGALMGSTASSLSYVVPEPGTGMLLAIGMLMIRYLGRALGRRTTPTAKWASHRIQHE